MRLLVVPTVSDALRPLEGWWRGVPERPEVPHYETSAHVKLPKSHRILPRQPTQLPPPGPLSTTGRKTSTAFPP